MSSAFQSLRVKRVVRETADASSFVFEIPPELSEVFRYEAGQFVTLSAPVSSLPIYRCYSMSSAPDVDDELRITVKRTPGGRVSNWLNDRLGEGETIGVSPPGGRFVLNGGSGEVIAFAGGSGITPVLSILKYLLAKTDRRARLLYANRDREAVIFLEELASLEARYPGRLHVAHHLDMERGFVTPEEVAGFAAEADVADFYICGPGPFMDTVEQALSSAGVERSRLHLERFTIEDNAGAEVPEVPEHVEVTVEIAGRRTTSEYRPGMTLLQTARTAGLQVPSSCEMGTCGTCMARLVEGCAVMRYDNVLTPEEVADGWVLTCQAVPTTATVHVVYE